MSGVAPSRLGGQPVGEIAAVAEGVYQLKLPVPFPLRFVSSYLFAGSGGWTVVDPGFDYPAAREVWEAAASGVGLDLGRGVERIVVTHLHPDHIGLARWLQERSGAPVLMLAREAEVARRVWDPERDLGEFVRFLVRNGMDEETARPTAGTTDLGIRVPEEIVPLNPGEKLRLGEVVARIIHTPGHSDYHFVLHDEERGMLVAGDQLLLKITPNIGLWPYTAPRPLRRYLSSIRELSGLSADLVLPGHGPLFHDLPGRVDELVSHHAQRLEVMHAAFGGCPATPYEIARRVFPAEELSPHQLRFALAETLAHLEHLADEGRAELLEEEPAIYAPLRP
ncbi:MBL fold metallo-hydrolase [Rubrobacter xylanophilus]|uniref:MBL fold metallo-hydrolase n=1 Tax=Rubrobacter xylanophilus TaxID=49319 RepID=A0A510HGY6_9ACTN|nr:MBL fold metallo-hydrolase [Rubrobacter xylanophilus]